MSKMTEVEEVNVTLGEDEERAFSSGSYKHAVVLYEINVWSRSEKDWRRSSENDEVQYPHWLRPHGRSLPESIGSGKPEEACPIVPRIYVRDKHTKQWEWDYNSKWEIDWKRRRQIDIGQIFVDHYRTPFVLGYKPVDEEGWEYSTGRSRSSCIPSFTALQRFDDQIRAPRGVIRWSDSFRRRRWYRIVRGKKIPAILRSGAPQKTKDVSLEKNHYTGVDQGAEKEKELPVNAPDLDTTKEKKIPAILRSGAPSETKDVSLEKNHDTGVDEGAGKEKELPVNAPDLDTTKPPFVMVAIPEEVVVNLTQQKKSTDNSNEKDNKSDFEISFRGSTIYEPNKSGEMEAAFVDPENRTHQTQSTDKSNEKSNKSDFEISFRGSTKYTPIESGEMEALFVDPNPNSNLEKTEDRKIEEEHQPISSPVNSTWEDGVAIPTPLKEIESSPIVEKQKRIRSPTAAETFFYQNTREVSSSFTISLYPTVIFEDKPGDAPRAIDEVCKAIRKATKGWGMKQSDLVNVMGGLSPTDRFYAHRLYPEMYNGQKLDKLVKEEAPSLGYFGTTLQLLAFPNNLADVKMVRLSMKGLGLGLGINRSEHVLFQIVCGRTNTEIDLLKKSYFSKYDIDLSRFLADELSGDFKLIILTCLQGVEKEYDPNYHTKKRAQADAELFHKAGMKQLEMNQKLINIICNSPPDHLQALSNFYIDKYGYNLSKVLEEELDGIARDAAIYHVNMKLKPYEAAAAQIKKSCAGLGTDEFALTCCIVQYHKILKQVDEAHIKAYNKSISERIKDEVSGHYRHLLTKVVVSQGWVDTQTL